MAPANPRSPSPRRVTPRLRPVVCDECAPPRPRPLSFFLLPCLRGRGFPPLVPSSAFVGPAGFGSAVSGRPPVSSALLRYARAVKGNPPTRGPPCVHGGRGGLSLSFLILTAVCLDEQTLAYSMASSLALQRLAPIQLPSGLIGAGGLCCPFLRGLEPCRPDRTLPLWRNPPARIPGVISVDSGSQQNLLQRPAAGGSFAFVPLRE